MRIKIVVIQHQKIVEEEVEAEDVVEERIEINFKMINFKEMIDLIEILKMIGIKMEQIKMKIKKMINFREMIDLKEIKMIGMNQIKMRIKKMINFREMIDMKEGQLEVLEILEIIDLIDKIELIGLKILVQIIKMKNQLRLKVI